MPHISRYQFGLLNAIALKHSAAAGGEVAVLMEFPGPPPRVQGEAPLNGSAAPRILAAGRHPSNLANWDTRTAIVNVMSRADVLASKYLFCTYQPTVACIGMMKTHDITAAAWVDNGVARYINMRAHANVRNLAPAALPAVPSRERLPVPVAAPATYASGADAARWVGDLDVDAASANLDPWRQSLHHAQPFKIGRRGSDIAQIIDGCGGPGAPQEFADFVYSLLTFAIADRAYFAGKTSRIAALLAKPTGEIYGWQVNARGVRVIYHAETNLVQLLDRRIPDGATLYSTLEPCHQCAGMYVRAGGTRCVFGQLDPNMTGNTALTGGNLGQQTATRVMGVDVMQSLRAGTNLDTERARAGVRAIDFLETPAAVAQMQTAGAFLRRLTDNTLRIIGERHRARPMMTNVDRVLRILRL